MRGGAAAIAASAVLASCVAMMPIPPAPNPPVIEWAGVPDEVRIGATIIYVLADGSTIELQPEDRRVLNPSGFSGELVVLGQDANGPFVAGFLRQEGLPADCFVENAEGIDRGAAIEIHGVLWPKDVDFAPAEPVAPDTAYPPGTRFCFGRDGEVSSTIGR